MVFARHAEELADGLDGGQARAHGHFFSKAGEGIVQAPGGAGFKRFQSRFKVTFGNIGQEADWHQALGEDVVDQGFGLDVGEGAPFQIADFGG